MEGCVKEISKSAQGVAYLRTIEETLSGDTLACHLVDDEARGIAEQWLQAYPEVARQVSLRGRYIEDIASRSIEQGGTRQAINIAAGLNTFPYRHPAASRLIRYAELDSEPMIQTKRRLFEPLVKRGIARLLPNQLLYVPINLAAEDLEATFNRMDWNWHEPTFFIFEGISYYLPLNILKRTLATLSRRSAKGSIVAMDYFPARVESTEVFRRVMGSIAQGGEPCLTCPKPEEIKSLFQEFEILSDRDLPDIEKEYCSDCFTIDFDAIVIAKKAC